MTHFLHVGLLFLWLLYCGELEVISFLSSYRCTKIIMMQSNDYNLIFPMTVWYKQDKQSAGRSDEVVFKPDWVTVGFTVLPPLPHNKQGGLPCMGKERQRSYCTGTKGSARKTAHEYCRHARVVKAERRQGTTMCFHFSSLSNDSD